MLNMRRKLLRQHLYFLLFDKGLVLSSAMHLICARRNNKGCRDDVALQG